MPAHRHSVWSRTLLVALAALPAGCTGPSSLEKGARADVAAVGRGLGADAGRSAASNAPRLAPLTPDSPQADFVRFAVYTHPAVRAAYYDWRASVEAIAPARALPDPQLTFEADISNMLMTLMPGLMFDIMLPGKRAAMAHEAAATSGVAYQTYVSTVVRVAGDVRKAWVELAYAQDANALYQHTIHAAEQAVALAGAEYTTGRGMVNFEQQIRFQNVLAQHHSHHAGIAERLVAAKMRFKLALGLQPTDPDPAWPNATLTLTAVPNEAELWNRVLTANPDLTKMRAMVDMALAGTEVARKGGLPDFTVGAMADLKADPLMVRPTATMTLPIWREKIRANIAAAEARHDAAVARVTAEQLNMAAELAQMLFMIREADSMLVYMNLTALPNLQRSLASAEAAVQSGMGNPTMIAEVQLMTVDMQHERLDALRDREKAAVDLAIMLVDVLPDGAPLAPSSKSQATSAK